MSYRVLARKWRPQVFDDVLGQEHVTSILKNMLATGRIHHGYLFCGTRGIGKTTTARILAKALNCVHGPTPTPCNQCEFCKEITAGYALDVEEIDGASNRGVDEVRVLQDDVGYAPSRSRYKVFIIDEVHSLTKEAFNALLKTLEEPPPNVVFILATTEPWKVPLTILSRCQQFKFRPGSAVELVGLLEKLAAHEQITISPHSLALLVKTAAGSVRDAENLFDQVVGFSGQVVADKDVRYVLGIPDQELLRAFLTALLTHRTAQMLTLLEQLMSQGASLRLFCLELLERLRNLIVLKIAPQPEPYLVLFDYSRAELERYAPQTTLSELQQLYWLLAEAERQIKFSPTPRLLLEMACTKMAAVQALEPLAELDRQLAEIKDLLAAPPPIPSTPPFDDAQARLKTTAAQPQPDRENPAILPAQELGPVWEAVVALVKQERPAFAPYVAKAIPLALTQDTLTLGFAKENSFAKSQFEDQKKTTVVQEALQAMLGRSVRVVTTFHTAAAAPIVWETPPPPEIVRPAPVVKPPPPAARPTPNAAPKNTADSKDNWKNRAKKPARQYKPPVQVTVQEIVKLFDGEIDE